MRVIKNNKPFKLYVLIDTNIFYTDFWLKGIQFKALKNMLSTTDSVLIIPEVVRLEVEKKFKEQLKTDFGNARKIKSKYNGAIQIKKKEDKVLTDFQENWQKYTRAGRSIREINHSKLSVDDLLARSLSEKPPFGKKSKGFRDAVIWETGLSYIKDIDDSCPFVLISKNTEDFGKSGLDDTLVKELEAQGRKHFYYQDLGTFLKAHGEQFDFLTDDLVKKWVDAEESYLEDVATDTYNYDVDRHDVEHHDAEDIELDEVEFEDYNVYSYYVIDEDDESYHIAVEVEIEAYGHVSYQIPVDPWLNDEWSSSAHYVNETDSVSLSTSIELIFSVNKKTKKQELV